MVLFYHLRTSSKTVCCRALLTSELEEIFAAAPLAPNDIAHAHVREAYARATGKTVAASAAAGGPPKRIPKEAGTDCAICYDEMYGVKEALLVFCKACGNCLHKQCFEQCASYAAC